MGVSGFSSWVSSHEAGISNESFRNLPLIDPSKVEGLTLFIDGSSLAFMILDSLGHKSKRELCGDYAAIGTATREWIEKVMGNGFSNLIVVKDGKASPLKRDTLEQRRQSQERDLRALVKFLFLKERRHDAGGFPTPFMFLDEFYGTLKEIAGQLDASADDGNYKADEDDVDDDRASLRILQASGEADGLLAEMCRESNLAGRPAVVLSDDTDFFFCKSVPFAFLKEFDSGEKPVRFFHSHTTAECLGIGEDLLVDLAIAIGNDICVGFDVPGFGNAQDMIDQKDGGKTKKLSPAAKKFQSRAFRVEALLRLFKSRALVSGSGVKLDLPNSGQLDFIIGHGAPESRAFYENQGYECLAQSSALLDDASSSINQLLAVEVLEELDASKTQEEEQVLLEAGRVALEFLVVESEQEAYETASRDAPQLLKILRKLARLHAQRLSDKQGIVSLSPDAVAENMISQSFSQWRSSFCSMLPQGDNQADYYEISKAGELSIVLAKLRHAEAAGNLLAVDFDSVCELISDAHLHASTRLCTSGKHEWLDYCMAYGFVVVCRQVLQYCSKHMSSTNPEEEQWHSASTLLPHRYFVGDAFFPSLPTFWPLCDAAVKTIRDAQLDGQEAAPARLKLEPSSSNGSRPASGFSFGEPSPGFSFGASSASKSFAPSGPEPSRPSFSPGKIVPKSGKRAKSSSSNKKNATHHPSRQEELTHAPITVTGDDLLPIDHHRDTILSRIERNRVTVIQGETGSGKSSRTPLMLLEEAFAKAAREGIPTGKLGPKNDIFVSQPRRIAARSLSERVRNTLRPDLRDLAGLRLGGGVREESNSTVLWYVTAGYFVRKLAGDPSFFDTFSHLFLDEVHERTVEMDLLCLLAKKLVERHASVKLILMSATLQASVYQEYFGLKEPALFVGVKRFPLTEYFLDSFELGDGVVAEGRLSHHDFQKIVDNFDEKLSSQRLSRRNKRFAHSVDPGTMRSLYKVCVDLVCTIAREEQGDILIFVSGLSGITTLFNEFEQINARLAEENSFPSAEDYGQLPLSFFRLVAIHSNIPYQEQLAAWDQASSPGERKVIIATNSAESSITLPDVDTVVCFGTHKTLEYDRVTGTQTLAERYISRASAIQRAGRTARTRPGTVYRLYTSSLWDLMAEFDTPEIENTPMEKVILDLKAMVNGPVKPLLQELIDPPDENEVESSMERLVDYGLLNSQADEGSVLTLMGRFTSALGLDLRLGMLVFRGVVFGVIAEAVAIAAVLSAPQSPFRVASPLVLKVHEEYHKVIQSTKSAQFALSKGLHSDVLGMVRLLSVWEAIPSSRARRRLARELGLAYDRMSHLSVTFKHLQRTVARLVGKPVESIELNHPQTLLTDPKRVNRLLLVMFQASDGLFEMQPSNSDVNPIVFLDTTDLETPWYSFALNSLSSTALPELLSLEEAATLFPPSVKWALVKRSRPTSPYYVADLKSLNEENDNEDNDEEDSNEEDSDEKDFWKGARQPLEVDATFGDADGPAAAFLRSVARLVLSPNEVKAALEAIGPQVLADESSSKPTQTIDFGALLDKAKPKAPKGDKSTSKAATPTPFADMAWVEIKQNPLIRSRKTKSSYFNSEDESDFEDDFSDSYEEIWLRGYEDSSSDDDYETNSDDSEGEASKERLIFQFLFLPRQSSVANPLAALTDEAFSTLFSGIGREHRIQCELREEFSTLDVACYSVPKTIQNERMKSFRPLVIQVREDHVRVQSNISSASYKAVLAAMDQNLPIATMDRFTHRQSVLTYQELYVQHDNTNGHAPLGLQCIAQYGTRRDARGKILMTSQQDPLRKSPVGFVVPSGFSATTMPIRTHIPQGPGSSKEANLFAKTSIKRCFVDGRSCEHMPGFGVEGAPLIAMSHGVRLIETAKSNSQGRTRTLGPDLAILDEVSLLPKDWINLALPCIGASSPGSTGSDLVRSCYGVARRLHEVSQSTDIKLEQNDPLIASVDEIFEDFQDQVAQPLPEHWLIMSPDDVPDTQPSTNNAAAAIRPFAVPDAASGNLLPEAHPVSMPAAPKISVGDFLSEMEGFVTNH